MTYTTGERTAIIGGVDTHQDLHTAAVVNLDGAVLGGESFSTTRAGYRAHAALVALSWGSCFASGSNPPAATARASPATWRCRGSQCSK